MVSFLLDTMNVDKHIYNWVYSLIKYGDVYLRLFKESDMDTQGLFKAEEINRRSMLTESKDLQKALAEVNAQEKQADEERAGDALNEDVIVSMHSVNDHYTHYVERVANPSEMFELTRFGKTMGYIKAPAIPTTTTNDAMLSQAYWNYKYAQQDITVYQATDFVHAALEDNSSRTPEVVTIFSDEDALASGNGGTDYSVRRGQSLLANTFKTWRELSLLENAILLNRITKSSIVRAIQMEVGDMPPEKVQSTMQRLKSLVEQKSSLKTNERMAEYTNPGPIENNIYIPVHEGRGAITTEQIGGQDADVKNLADLDYFQNNLFGSLRIPKQYFGQTDDSTGFNGGSSLAIISSRYGKAIKRIQNTILQALTDAINLMLLDKGLTTYVNQFTLRMTTPTTQEEIDRREASSNQIRNVTDILNMLNDIEDVATKLKILKSLLATVVTDSDILGYIQDQIDILEKAQADEEAAASEADEDQDVDIDVEFENRPSAISPETEAPAMETPEETPELATAEIETPAEEPAEASLPTPAQAMGETEPAGESLEEELPTFEALGVNGFDL